MPEPSLGASSQPSSQLGFIPCCSSGPCFKAGAFQSLILRQPPSPSSSLASQAHSLLGPFGTSPNAFLHSQMPLAVHEFFPNSASTWLLISSSIMPLCKLLLTFLVHVCAGGSASTLPRQGGCEHRPSSSGITLAIAQGLSKICFTLLKAMHPYPEIKLF